MNVPIVHKYVWYYFSIVCRKYNVRYKCKTLISKPLKQNAHHNVLFQRFLKSS